MSYEERYEPEIDLKDLFFHVLYRWRSVMAVAVACCALLSAYKAARMAELTPEERVPKKVREYELALERYELDKASYEREIGNDLERLEQQREYVEKSVLMRVDPYRKPIASIDLFVKLDAAEWETLPDNLGMDPTDSVIKTYTSGFASMIDWKPVQELTGMDERYLREMLNVYTDYNSNTFTLSIVYLDGDTAQEILDVILEQVLDRHESVEQAAGAHEILVTNRTFSYIIDTGLAESQKSNVAAITGYERSVLGNREKLEELEEPGEPRIIGFVKYPIAGMALGGFLGVLFWGVHYLVDGRIHGKRNMQDRYGFPLLGVMPPSERKGMFSCVDRLLDGLAFGRGETEEVCRHIAITVTRLAGEGKKVLLAGTVGLDKVQGFVEVLADQMPNVILSGAENVGEDANALAAAENCDAVVLLEKLGWSRRAKVRRECECIRALGKTVIGYVLL